MTKSIFFKRKAGWPFQILLLIILAVSVFLLYPGPISPVSWTPPEDQGFIGAFAINGKLMRAERIELAKGKGPEDISVAEDGTLYVGYENGDLYRIPPGGREEFILNTGGRAIGHDFDANGNLIIADSRRGLIRLMVETDTLEVLTTASNGVLFGFADDVDVAPDGRIYFSDASFAHGPEELNYDILEGRGNGRLLRYDPVTRKTETLLDTLYFANGIAVSPDGSFVLVNETTRYRMQRYWISGPKAGTAEIVMDNLPGFPDGVSYDGQGGYWLALYSPRSKDLDALHPEPFYKSLLAKLPAFVSPKPIKHGVIVHLSAELEIDGVYHDATGTHSWNTTSVEQVGDTVYIGNLTESFYHKVTLEALRR